MMDYGKERNFKVIKVKKSRMHTLFFENVQTDVVKSN